MKSEELFTFEEVVSPVALLVHCDDDVVGSVLQFVQRARKVDQRVVSAEEHVNCKTVNN